MTCEILIGRGSAAEYTDCLTLIAGIGGLGVVGASRTAGVFVFCLFCLVDVVTVLDTLYGEVEINFATAFCIIFRLAIASFCFGLCLVTMFGTSDSCSGFDSRFGS